MLHFSDEVLFAGHYQGYPLRYPRFASQDQIYLNYRDDNATLVATGEDPDYPASNVVSGFDWDWWTPDSLPAGIESATASLVAYDYLGVAAHDLGSKGCSIRPVYLDGSTPTYLTASHSPSDDSPILFLFNAVSTTSIAIEIDGSEVPNIGVIQAGIALSWPRPIYQGHVPMPLNRQTDIRPNKSEDGRFLGRSVIRRGTSTDFSSENLPYEWVRSSLDPFIKRCQTRPFFFAWRPDKAPQDVSWGWVNEDIVPENSGPRDLMSVKFTIVGTGNE